MLSKLRVTYLHGNRAAARLLGGASSRVGQYVASSGVTANGGTPEQALAAGKKAAAFTAANVPCSPKPSSRTSANAIYVTVKQNGGSKSEAAMIAAQLAGQSALASTKCAKTAAKVVKQICQKFGCGRQRLMKVVRKVYSGGMGTNQEKNFSAVIHRVAAKASAKHRCGKPPKIPHLRNGRVVCPKHNVTNRTSFCTMVYTRALRKLSPKAAAIAAGQAAGYQAMRAGTCSEKVAIVAASCARRFGAKSDDVARLASTLLSKYVKARGGSDEEATEAGRRAVLAVVGLQFNYSRT